MALHHRVIEASTSGQSHLIVAAVLLSFVVWVTLQNHLRTYLNALGIGAPPPIPQGAGAAGAGGITGGGAGGLFPPGSIPFPYATPPIFGPGTAGN